MVSSFLLAGVKDIFKNGQPNCHIIAIFCAGGRHRSVMCAELAGRFLAMHDIEYQTVHICHPTWGRLCHTCEHCVWVKPPTCQLAKERNANLHNIVEILTNNALHLLNASAQNSRFLRRPNSTTATATAAATAARASHSEAPGRRSAPGGQAGS